MIKMLKDRSLYILDERSGYWTIGTSNASECITDGIIGGIDHSEVYWSAKCGESLEDNFRKCIEEYLEACDKMDYESETPVPFEGEYEQF